MEFNIPDMTCGHCVKAITHALRELDPVATLSVDLPAKKVIVQTTQGREQVAAVLTQAGYPTE